MQERVDISELDVIFLSYDEPNADANWAQLRSLVPWAKRVHGIKGSDAAHKAAGEASGTERFMLVDGDNLVVPTFWSQSLLLDDINRDKVFRWKALNVINGLCYGNGGVSSWTRDFVRDMRTHENTDGRAETQVEFCFDDGYWAMHDCWSTTHANATPYQAWRAGFREGVKMCLDRGKRIDPVDFEGLWRGNRRNLGIWCNVGADVDNGVSAMLGARQGAVKAMFDDEFDVTMVRDFDRLREFYDEYKVEKHADVNGHMFKALGETLSMRLDMPMLCWQAESSRFFKESLELRENKGMMVRE